jgi:magnesium chelatase accessory protein
LDWKSEGHNWPNRECSQFIKVNGTNWHIQQKGEGSKILLLHGSGATTHSMRGLFTELSKSHNVMTLDFPGHGFSSRLGGGKPTLNRVSDALAVLLQERDFMPELIVGHSAGAAVAVNLASKTPIQPNAIVSINGAFYPFPGFAGQIFPATAKFLFVNPLMSHFFAFGAASKSRVERLIDSTGSKLDSQGLSYYQRALQSPNHIEGTLAMMAFWELGPMTGQLSALDIPLLQVIGSNDGTIEPSASLETAKLLTNGHRHDLPGYGHLVHEEIPEKVSELIREFFLNKT